MKKTFETLALLLKQLNEEQLVASIPIFSQLTSQLVDEIRKSKSYDSADTAFDILKITSSSLARLANIHNRELPADLMEVLKVEGFLYPDQNGQYKESREPLYDAIKRGDVLKSV